MRRLLLLLLLILAVPAHADLLVEENAGVVPVKARLDSTALGPARLTVETAHPVTLLLDMPAMPTMPLVKKAIPQKAPGRWETDLDFTMEGVWRLRLLVETPNGDFQIARTVTVGPAAPPKAPKSPPPPSQDGPSPTLELLHPARVGDNRVRVVPPKGAMGRVWVAADMPGMQMGTPPLEAMKQADGSFQATVPLSMEGLWRLTAEVKCTACCTVKKPRLGTLEVTVQTPPTPSASLVLLALTLLALLVTRRRPAVALLLLATFAVGAVVQRLQPDTDMGMAMDMAAPDMGLGPGTAPLPVLEARVGRVPFTVTGRYRGTVEAASERVVTAPAAGPVLQTPRPGHLARGVVARVGPHAVRGSGAVLRNLVHLGQQVEAGQPLLVIGDVSTVRVKIRVPAKDHGRLLPGSPVTVAAMPGRVAIVSALGEGDTVFAEALVPNVMATGGHGAVRAPEGDLPRMFAVGQEVEVQAVLSQSNSLCVPREAVREGPAVFVIEDLAGRRVARRRTVTVAESNGTHTEIASGLREGEVVVASADSSLQDGGMVTLGTRAGPLIVPAEGHHP